MKRKLVLSTKARDDLNRLHEFLAAKDVDAAERAIETIEQAFQAATAMPYAHPKIETADPLTRQVLISFGSSGYVASYRIRDTAIHVLRVRHQREGDFH